MAENESFVVRVTATDANTSDRIESFTLSGDDAASFTIPLDGRDGLLSFTAAPDFEAPGSDAGTNVYDVSITATSGTGDRVSVSDAFAFTVTVTNVNEPPVITSTGDTFSVPENSTDVTTVTADDLDAADSVTGYTLDGDDASRFAITAGGVLTFAVAPNFEDPKDTGGPNGDNVYIVIVQALGGAEADGRQLPSEGQTITVTVTNVDEGAEVLGDTDREVTEDGNGTARRRSPRPGPGRRPDPPVRPPRRRSRDLRRVQHHRRRTLGLHPGQRRQRYRPVGRAARMVNDEFTVTATATDADDSTEGMVTIRVTGFNDPTRFGGVLAGEITEDATPNTVGGTLTFTDPDGADTITAITTPEPGTYGSFAIDAAGAWTYTLDNNDEDTNALDDGDTVADRFTVTAADGTTVEIVITVTGADDPSVFGGELTGSITEDADENVVGGTMTIDDPDDSSSIRSRTYPGTYGDLRVRSSGDWTYTLDNDDEDTNALDSGATVTETFSEIDASGTDINGAITITVTGANDDSVWTGDTAATVIEDAEGDTVSGNLAVADVDSSDTPAILDRSGNANYGSFTVTAATGAWTYTLFNANLDVDALDNRNDTLIDTFDTTADDGTSQTVTITIRGADDASVISGGMTGAVTEAGDENNGGIGNPTATGSLTVSDVDGDDSPTIEAQTITGVYGSLAVLEGGAWTYTLDDDDPQTQALGESHPGAEDTFAVEADDSNTVKVTITVTGADDLATFDDGNTGAVTEDARSTASGSYDIDDVDADDRPAWEPQADADGTYGTFSIDSRRRLDSTR